MGAEHARIADALQQVADPYDAQNGDAFRVRAYRSAAATVRALDADVAQLWSREGLVGLQQLSHVGPNICKLTCQRDVFATARCGLPVRAHQPHR